MSLSIKPIFRLIAATALLLTLSPRTRAADPLKTKDESAASSGTTSEPSLRKPGFVFMELGTTHVEDYLSFFESVAEFKLMSRKPGYIQARSELAEITFIDPKFWSNGHPFSGKLKGSDQGLGIEIGIVVANLDQAHAAALQWKDKGWPVATGIVRRPWGVRDFRVLAPDGYYLRFTEGR
jgi:lactoylglutathione lyase